VVRKLKLRPLLVTYNKYFNTPQGIANLALLRTIHNLDMRQLNPNPNEVKKIIKYTLANFGNIYWPILAGQSVYPVWIAAETNTPLIIWGAHQGIEQVGMFSHVDEVEMSRRNRKDHDLFCLESEDLTSPASSLNKNDVFAYRYPSDSTLFEKGIRGIYLGNYIPWDPKTQHEQMISEYGYNTRHFARTFDRYDYVDCFNYMDLHDLLKLYKHGYSKVTDHATREIRHKRLSRVDGLSLVKEFELQAIEHLDWFCDWLGVRRDAVEFILESHKNLNYWERGAPGFQSFQGWSSYSGTVSAETIETSSLEYVSSDWSRTHSKPGYTCVGKGLYEDTPIKYRAGV
jgi:hypothetical protein